MTTPVDLQDRTLVAVGAPKVTGAFFIAPAGTTLPTDCSTALGSAFACVGYISDNGVVLSEEDGRQEIDAWGHPHVRIVKATYHEVVKLQPLEYNETVLKEQYGADNVTVTTSSGVKTIATQHTADDLPDKVGVIEVVPADNMVTRYVFPVLRLTEKGDITLNGRDPMGRELTYNAERDSTGTSCYEYTAITVGE